MHSDKEIIEKKNNSQNNKTKTNDSYELSSQKTGGEKTNDITKHIEFLILEEFYLSLIKKILFEKETIGKGGQAIIKKYYSTQFKRTVVEKVININSSTRDTLGDKGIWKVLNLIKEASILCGFDHPNIVKIYDFQTKPPAIIMEYCSRGNLRQFLDKRADVHPFYKHYLIYSICNGLKTVHSKGIVHGDLKCANILLSDEKKFYIGKESYPIPKIADFGLSQLRPNTVAAGTPGFIAPEVLKGSGLSFKTDIFALGMVMFEILSGLKPLNSNYGETKSFFKERKIPCTKEILKLAWELKIEEFLPRVNDKFYKFFYSIMIKCIDDDPEKRPSIFDIFTIVESLYEILLKLSKDYILDESKDSIK